MKTLWTPWRVEHVLGDMPKPAHCIFEPEGDNICSKKDLLHFHIVPRWDGDHNFISVVADIRTIPEHINATFDKLLPDFLDLHHTDNE